MYKGKKVLVCGMGKSGQSAASLLISLGTNVTVQDTNSHINWQHANAQYHLGATPDAIVQDFDLVVISPGISIYEAFVAKAKSLGIPVWGEVELAYSLCQSPIIAITGTNGKTTVTTLVGEIFKAHNGRAIVGGNIGIPLTDFIMDTSPEDIIAAEISSFQLETTQHFNPKVAAVLNITEDHLDRHLTMENYIAMKARIFENQTPSDICVLNYDNIITRHMEPPGQVLYFSQEMELDAGVFVKDGWVVARLPDQPEIQVGKMADMRQATMVENVLAVVAIALSAGADPKNILDTMINFKGVPHRLEKIRNINGVKYINDSKATNTDAAIKALEAMEGNVILIAGGYDKNTDFTPWVEYFPGKVGHVILIGQTADLIIDSCKKVGFTNYSKADTLADATHLAKDLATPGDTVLLSPACASFGMFKNFEARGDAFKDIVNRL